MPNPPKVGGTTNLERILIFFVCEFCPELQHILHDERERGLTNRQSQAIQDFIVYARHRAAILGDQWWFNTIRFEKTIERRIENVHDIVGRWCRISGTDGRAVRARKRCSNKLTRAVVKLSKTHRRNMHLLRINADLVQLKNDIEFFNNLRTIGLASLKDTVDAAIAEIFKNRGSRPRR